MHSTGHGIVAAWLAAPSALAAQQFAAQQFAPQDKFGNFQQVDYRIFAPDRIRALCALSGSIDPIVLLKKDDLLVKAARGHSSRSAVWRSG
ncbi:MAG TPA: hypothetical protein VHW65_09820 [Gemmatimonadales bacterium]|jgi:hypothetical protein|nr:hypothetical protein [Gemmatimonadales bacterium]